MHCHDLFFSIFLRILRRTVKFFKKHNKFLEGTKYIVRCTTAWASIIWHPRSWDFCSGDGSCIGILDFNTVFLPNLCIYQSQGLTGYSPTHPWYILHIPAASQPIQLDPLSDWLSISNAWIGAYPAYQNSSPFDRQKPNTRCQVRILACKMYCPYRHSPFSTICICNTSLHQWHEKSGWPNIYTMKSIVCWPPF